MKQKVSVRHTMPQSDSGSGSHPRSPLPPVARGRPPKPAARARAPAVQRSKRTEWTGPPLLYRGGTGNSCERFMDRSFMQQMQQRLLEQHEDTLRRRIRERQAEEVQRERQLVLSGLIPATSSPTPQQPPSKRNMSRSATTARRSPRPRTARRLPNASPRPQSERSSRKQVVDLTDSLDPADELDEAAESQPPPVRPPDPRPRLALLMQACRAVVGAHHADPELPPLPARRVPESEDTDEISLLRLKYESPLIAQLREVESVEELYRLAEMIVASTKHP